jgi:hypothetical protein
MTGFSSMAMAEDYLREQALENPKLSKEIHILPNTEINNAA